MKHLIVVIALIALVAAQKKWLPRNATGIRELHRECANAVELTPGQREKIENMEFPDEEKVRIYVICVAGILGVFCPNKGYHQHRLLKQFDAPMKDEEVLSIINGCHVDNEQNSPPDVYAFRGQQCIMKSRIGDMLKEIFKEQKETFAKEDAPASVA